MADLRHGDCREVMATLPEASVDAIVTDPPYELGFMGKRWDAAGVSFDPETWRAAHRVLKPGGHLLAFGGTRTFHRIAVAIEDAGFEVRDCLSWLYGSGFPKSHDVGKAMDREAGAAREVVGSRKSGIASTHSTFGDDNWKGIGQDTYEVTAPATNLARQWDGWGTALKPAWEPIIVARKPLAGTVAQNVAQHGTGALNIDGCRIDWASDTERGEVNRRTGPNSRFRAQKAGGVTGAMSALGERHVADVTHHAGRWPANVCLDEDAAALLDAMSGTTTSSDRPRKRREMTSRGYKGGGFGQQVAEHHPFTGHTYGFSDTGGASRFFYVAKASRRERNAGLEGMPEQNPWDRHSVSRHMEGMGNLSQPRANHHPTVKPVALMRWLVRLVTPPDGLVLDPFMGSGTTGIAAALEDFGFIGIEQDAEYLTIAERRIAHWAEEAADDARQLALAAD